jgi:hypothetical protein
LMDWGDACISHPFFTLSVTLEGVIAWGLDDVEGSVDTAPFRDAYLAPFADRYDAEPGRRQRDRGAPGLGLPRRQRPRAGRGTRPLRPGCGCSSTDVPDAGAGKSALGPTDR